MNNNNILTKQEVQEQYNRIQEIFLSDELPWIIGYSGGKDSTVVLQLVWNAIAAMNPEKRGQKPIYVISTDTLIESPIISDWIKRSHEMMKIAAEDQNLNIYPKLLTPSTKDTFWVNFIGKGYPFPRMNTQFRWCTSRLKRNPSHNFINEKIAGHGEAIVVLGTRKAESTNRARTIGKYEKSEVRDHLTPDPNLPNSLIFQPIKDWSNDQVWQYLNEYKNPWGLSNVELKTMYKSATEGGVCPMQVGTQSESCGKSRFGCWVCTVVEKDKSMEAMIDNDPEKEWLGALLDFRNEIADHDKDRGRRSFRRMSGKLTLLNERLVHGPYTKRIREYWLKELLEVQNDIPEIAPDVFKDLKLITDDELREIRRMWLVDKHEFCDSLPTIYKECLGKEFKYKDEFPNGAFGLDEWNELENICKELYPEEELLLELQSSLLDIEKRSIMLKLRKGLLNDLDSQLRKCYYRNEDDALAYAQRISEIKDSVYSKVMSDEPTSEEDYYEIT